MTVWLYRNVIITTATAKSLKTPHHLLESVGVFKLFTATVSYYLLVNAGNVGGWRSVWLRSDVPASSDQVSSSHEEGCWLSGAIHGERT